MIAELALGEYWRSFCEWRPTHSTRCWRWTRSLAGDYNLWSSITSREWWPAAFWNSQFTLCLGALYGSSNGNKSDANGLCDARDIHSQLGNNSTIQRTERRRRRPDVWMRVMSVNACAHPINYAFIVRALSHTHTTSNGDIENFGSSVSEIRGSGHQMLPASQRSVVYIYFFVFIFKLILIGIWCSFLWLLLLSERTRAHAIDKLYFSGIFMCHSVEKHV